MPDAESNKEATVELPKLATGQGTVFEIAEHLQALTQKAASACEDSESKQDLEAVSKHWLLWLQRLASATSPEEFNRYVWSKSSRRGENWQPLVHEHGRFSADFILQCLQVTFGALISTTCSGSAYFRNHMRRVIQCLPPNLASLLEEPLDKVVLPSRQTLDRGRLWLDSAFMIYQRDVNKAGIERGDVLYVLGDASPLAHKNMLMLEHWRLDGSKVALAGQAAMYMKQVEQVILTYSD